MKIYFSHIIFYWIWMLGTGEVFGQTTVGMGTENPNSNAVLELVSESMDQGFLVPRFTTDQRTASGFTRKLSSKDNGLLVFDTDEGKFYYWYDGAWQQGIATGAVDMGTVWYTGNTTPRNNEGENGDFYIHTLSGDLYRKQNGVFSVIGNILPQKNEYTAGQGISIGAGNVIVNTGDLDNSNELIKGVSLLGETLRISDAGGDHDVNLSSYQKTALNTSNILVGNASNVATPVTVSGDLILNSDGTMKVKLDAITTAKIINDAVDKDKIHANVAGAGLGQNVDGSLEIKTTSGLQIAADQLSLTNTGNGQLLIGNGSTVNAQTISGDATLASDGTATVTGLQGRSVATTAPASGNVLTWNGTNWVPQAPSGGGGSGASWYSGNNLPNPGNPAGALDGDYYYRNSTEIVYRKISGTWVQQGKWAEQSGTTVTDAIITDITTPTLYNGIGKPTDGPSNNGKPGDLYYDADEDKLYIKKNNTQWTSF
jgi:hypothetical protein